MNKHHQKETFEDAEHDLIEDYSEDKELEAAEKEEAKNASTQPKTIGGVKSMFDGEDHPDGYVEERLDAKGNHIRKEVHKGDGWESVSITSESSGPVEIGEMGDIGGMIAMMMQQAAMQHMRGL